MNLLGFLATTTHPPTPMSCVQVTSRGSQGRGRLCLCPQHRDCPRAGGCTSPSLAPSWVCSWPSASPTFGHLSSSGPHFRLLSVAALKIERRIRSLQQFLWADAFNTNLAAGLGRMQRCTEGLWGAQGVFWRWRISCQNISVLLLLPPCEMAIPLLQLPGRVSGFLAVPQPVLLQDGSGESHALAAPRGGREHHPSPGLGHSRVQEHPLPVDTTSVLPSACGQHICDALVQGWCAPLLSSPEGLSSPDRPDKELFVCSGDPRAAVAGLQCHHCRATPLPGQCPNLSPAGGRVWRDGE